MERIEKHCADGQKEALWMADLGNGSYRNPILYTDYSDPDVIRVGEDYYLIASSFTYLPGVPVLHSKDLVNWEKINYCVRSLPFERYQRTAHGAGTWAPALRYHNGVFYAFIPLPDEGIFVTTATDPAGEWSELHCIMEGKGFIDPCPFWDEDGRAYMAFAYANSRCGIHSRISLCEMDVKATRILHEPVLIYDGMQTSPTIEGPKMYKRNGYYYIFAPAGGVEKGWQTVLRSANPYGPYEMRIVLHQGNTEVNGPHQGAYVDAPDGSEWFLHFQDAGAMGRILHLQPLCWREDWPFIGQEQNGDGIGEPVRTWRMPLSRDEGRGYSVTADDAFDTPELSLAWQWQANPNPAWYSMKIREGALALFCVSNPDRKESLLWYASNACTQQLQTPEFDAYVTLSLHGEEDGDFAGAGILGTRYSYAGLCRKDGEVRLIVRSGMVKDFDPLGRQNRRDIVEEETAAEVMPEVMTDIIMDVTPKREEEASVTLRLRVRKGICSYAYASGQGDYRELAGGFPLAKAIWTGAKFTLYACNLSNRASGGYGLYESVRFEPAANGREETL